MAMHQPLVREDARFFEVKVIDNDDIKNERKKEMTFKKRIMIIKCFDIKNDRYNQ